MFTWFRRWKEARDDAQLIASLRAELRQAQVDVARQQALIDSLNLSLAAVHDLEKQKREVRWAAAVIRKLAMRLRFNNYTWTVSAADIANDSDLSRFVTLAVEYQRRVREGGDDLPQT